MATIYTIVLAMVGVFVILGLWLVVDHFSRKTFGERKPGCCGHGMKDVNSGGGCGACQMPAEACPSAGEKDPKSETGNG